MAVSASAKSKAAAVSAMIRRDAGYQVRPTGDKHFTGITVRAAGGENDYPSITISDPYLRDPGMEGARRAVSQRREMITLKLATRGYTFREKVVEDEGIVLITVTGKRNARSTKEHKVELGFTIDIEAARNYLGVGPDEGDERSVAYLMSEAISEMIQASNAYHLGAIEVTANKFVR